jgi:hypothetical protein
VEIEKLNIYQRLRDFDVPASVLDMVFEDKDDLNQLINAWDALKSDGFTDDETAKEIAEIFFKEIDIQIDDD